MQCQQLTEAREKGRNKLGIFIKEPELVDRTTNSGIGKYREGPFYGQQSLRGGCSDLRERLRDCSRSGRAELRRERAHILNEERKETKTSFAKRFSSLLSLSGPQPIL